MDPGQTIRYFGDYVLFGRIAEGAMGEVWFARQNSLDRVVAVKLIRAGMLATASDVDRFHVEAQAAARLRHEHIVQVFEVGSHEGLHFLSMELIEGSSLAEQIRDGRWRLEADTATSRQRDMARLMIRIARAVHHAHQRGVLHRDIKPANILLDPQQQPHLSDFGLAKITDASSDLTRSGAVLGTLSYMSPEQAAGKNAEVTTASDLYSLGAVLYELLTGQPPFVDEDWVELLRKAAMEEPVRPSEVRRQTHAPAGEPSPMAPLDRDLEIICLKCLEKRPGDRYASADALAEDLERWLRGEPIEARPAGRLERAWKWALRHPVTAGLSAALVMALLAGLVTTSWQWWRAETQRRLTTEAYARLQLQRAEDFLGTQRSHLALPLLARLLRDQPDHRIAQERLVNALHERSILVPLATPTTNTATDPGATQLARRIAIAPQGQLVATATNADPTLIEWWHESDPAPSHVLTHAHQGVIRSLQCSAAATHLVSAGTDGTAKVWTVDPPAPLQVLPHPAAVHDATFSPDDRLVLTACRDGIARLWDAMNGALLVTFPPRDAPLSVVEFHPDGSLLAIGSDDGTLQLWTIADGTVRPFSDPRALGGPVWNLIFGADTLAATLDDGTVRQVQWTWPARVAQDGPISPTPDTPPAPVTSILGRRPSEFHDAPVTAVATSQDGRRLATASLDHTARIWDARTGEPITPPLVHAGPVNSVAFSPDGLRLATSSPGQVARVWDAATGQPLTGWIRFTRPVFDLAFSREGRRIETGAGETWPIHVAEERAPAWLPELAEALGGVRLDVLGRFESPADFSVVRRERLRSTTNDPLALWAKLLLEDGSEAP